jgi:hypothetical protein
MYCGDMPISTEPLRIVVTARAMELCEISRDMVIELVRPDARVLEYSRLVSCDVILISSDIRGMNRGNAEVMQIA